MVLVVVVMATAAIMAFALLSSASIQAQASRNSISSYTADGLAQSGTSQAMYYLMNPDQVSLSLLTTSNGKTFYNPGSNVGSISVSNGANVGSIAVSVESQNGLMTTYGIDVTANADSTGSLKRTQHSDVAVNSRYAVKYAMSSNDAFTIPNSGVSVSIGGNVQLRQRDHRIADGNHRVNDHPAEHGRAGVSVVRRAELFAAQHL